MGNNHGPAPDKIKAKHKSDQLVSELEGTKRHAFDSHQNFTRTLASSWAEKSSPQRVCCQFMTKLTITDERFFLQ